MNKWIPVKKRRPKDGQIIADGHLGCPFCGRVDIHPIRENLSIIACDDKTGEPNRQFEYRIRCYGCGALGMARESISLAWAQWDMRSVPERKE